MIPISFKAIGEVDNKVACIKAFRTLTGLGLKEAKDAIESIMQGECVKEQVGPAFLEDGPRGAQFETLRSNGIITSGVTTKHDIVLTAIRSATSVALADKQHELAIDLIEVLKKHDAE